jgi:hypothetical protein
VPTVYETAVSLTRKGPGPGATCYLQMRATLKCILHAPHAVSQDAAFVLLFLGSLWHSRPMWAYLSAGPFPSSTDLNFKRLKILRKGRGASGASSRQRVVSYLEANPGQVLSTSQISAATGLDRHKTTETLVRLVRQCVERSGIFESAGIVRRIGKGDYVYLSSAADAQAAAPAAHPSKRFRKPATGDTVRGSVRYNG